MTQFGFIYITSSAFATSFADNPVYRDEPITIIHWNFSSLAYIPKISPYFSSKNIILGRTNYFELQFLQIGSELVYSIKLLCLHI